MSDRYWDVRSCRWQGGADEPVPDWLAALARPSSAPAVPVQTQAEQVEVVPSLRERRATSSG